MRFPFFVLLLCLLALGCDRTQPISAGSTSSGNPDPNGVRFFFSPSPAVAGLKDANSWCNHSFTDAVLINADTGNINRRYFRLGEGVHRIAVQVGNMTASVVLRQSKDQRVEVFTSDNFPVCLSRRENFTLFDEGASLVYDNKKYIVFTLSGQPAPGGPVILLDIPAKPAYGLNVHRCVDCR